MGEEEIMSEEQNHWTKEINNRFTYHAPLPEQHEKFFQIRETARQYALLLIELCPDSRERSLALTHLEDVVYSANASIARRK